MHYSAKDEMEAREHTYDVLKQIAIDAKVLISCDNHDELLHSGSSDENAYKFANAAFSSGKIAGLFSSRTEMTDRMKIMLDDFYTECARCEDEVNQ